MKIDIFSHILPIKYKEALHEEIGESFFKRLHNSAPALFDTNSRFSIMDKFEELRHIATIPPPPVEEVMGPKKAVDLVKLANDLWQTFNVSPHQATQALLPLLRGTINNIDAVGIPQCLTGPIARGDTGTIKKHLKALQNEAPIVLSTYRELGLQTIPIALAKGRINQNKAKELEAILKQAS